MSDKIKTAEEIIHLHGTQLLQSKDGLLNEAKLHAKITFEFASESVKAETEELKAERDEWKRKHDHILKQFELFVEIIKTDNHPNNLKNYTYDINTYENDSENN